MTKIHILIPGWACLGTICYSHMGSRQPRELDLEVMGPWRWSCHRRQVGYLCPTSCFLRSSSGSPPPPHPLRAASALWCDGHWLSVNFERQSSLTSTVRTSPQILMKNGKQTQVGSWLTTMVWIGSPVLWEDREVQIFGTLWLSTLGHCPFG